MRHGKKFNHLGRQKGHRSALLSNMACSLIEHKRINTTIAKAKALRVYIEPLITRSKTDSTHSRRMVFRQLKSKFAVAELFRDVAPLVANRPGGYTRIIKTLNRPGDNAEMCMIELVDFNELMLKDSTSTKKGRSRRGSKKSPAKAAPVAAATESEDAPEAVVDTKVETAKVEPPKPEAPVKQAKAKKETPEAKTEEAQKAKKAAAPKAEAKKEEPSKEDKKKDDQDKKES
jgi:large subunit ribosomal protein L17